MALADLEESGLDLDAFAVGAGLDPQRLRRWRRTLASPAETVVFEEVVPGRPPREVTIRADIERSWFEVVLGSGRVVRVPEIFDPVALGRLLRVVDEEEGC
jgi:hypothetical protein